MKKLLILLLTTIVMVGANGAAPRRSSAQVKKDRQSNTTAIRQTRQQLEAARRNVEREFDRYRSLEAEIAKAKAEIGALKQRINKTDREIQQAVDSINITTEKIETLRQSYGRSLREARKNRQAMDATALVFSSRSFNEASRRMSYLKQIDKSRKAKSQQLKERKQQLEGQKQRLTELQQSQRVQYSRLAAEQTRLDASLAESTTLLASLRKQSDVLEATLRDRQAQAQRLEAELTAAIEREEQEAERQRQLQAQAREQARADSIARAQQLMASNDTKRSGNNNDSKASKNKKESKASTATKNAKNNKGQNSTTPATNKNTTPVNLSNNFAANKGKLPMPVIGEYKIVGTFGRGKYSDLEHVELENNGIDIEVAPGSNARAVFDGVVSSIFYMGAYHNIVMVRHDKYITVYTNIDTLSVRKGDTVKTGDSLGTIYADPNGSGRPVLHFEVRLERDKLNPLDWLIH